MTTDNDPPQGDSPSSDPPVEESPGSLRSLFAEPGRFVFAVEIETTRGLALEEPTDRMAKLAHNLVDLEGVNLLSLTDNPGGNPHHRPETLGVHLKARGQEVAVNVSCKDYNRNGIESRLWALGSQGFDNILALTGDYPIAGYAGQAQPVFDIDSVGLLELIQRLNEGYPPPPRSAAKKTPDKPTRFFPGAAVSPFKRHESEYVPQLLKLSYKVRTGAEWAVTQIGWDSRKVDELHRFVSSTGLNIPMLGSVYILTAPATRFFNRWGVPGIQVSNDLLAVVEKEAKAEDKGRAFFRELAAKQVAILKGVGYKGVYLGGRPSLPAVKQIMAKVESFGEDDWKDFAKELQYPLLDEFYYYEQDPQTRLSTPETNPKTLSSRSRVSRFGRSLTFSPAYGAGKTAHALAFGANAPGFTAGKLLYKSLDRAPGKIRSFAHALEQAGKFPLYGCHDCGDCSLPDIAYLCPESQCAKNQRNGPCGGTKDGQCEVLDKECIWSRAYKRLAASGDEQTMLERPVIYKNASLSGTSAWANTFLGRDHHSEGSPGNTSR